MLVVYTIYTGNLTAVLATKSPMPIKNLADLAAQDDINIIIEQGIVQMTLLKVFQYV